MVECESSTSTTRPVHVVGAIQSSERIKGSTSYEVAKTRIVIVARLALVLYNMEVKATLRMTSKGGGGNGLTTVNIVSYGSEITTPQET